MKLQQYERPLPLWQRCVLIPALLRVAGGRPSVFGLTCCAQQIMTSPAGANSADLEMGNEAVIQQQAAALKHARQLHGPA